MATYDAGVTTKRDHGKSPPLMLRCSATEGRHLFPSLMLALRDMRHASGRNPETGEGDGNESWIGLSIGMIVLDTLRGSSRDRVREEWVQLLAGHGVSQNDAAIIYALRCSVLHGYGTPRPEKAGRRTVVVTPDRDAYALDTTEKGFALVSVPVFCGCLVERIAYEAPNDWDASLLDTDFRLDLSRLAYRTGTAGVDVWPPPSKRPTG
jgi:hypothetical protein